MQTALMTIWKRRRKISEHAVPQALALKICVNAACDIARRRVRDRRSEGLEALTNLVIGDTVAPSDSLANQEVGSAIVKAISRLSRRQAVAITLRVLEDLPYEQIAAAMDCTEATARKHAERARAHLRVVLAKHDPQRLTRS